MADFQKRHYEALANAMHMVVQDCMNLPEHQKAVALRAIHKVSESMYAIAFNRNCKLNVWEDRSGISDAKEVVRHYLDTHPEIKP